MTKRERHRERPNDRERKTKRDQVRERERENKLKKCIHPHPAGHVAPTVKPSASQILPRSHAVATLPPHTVAVPAVKLVCAPEQ